MQPTIEEQKKINEEQQMKITTLEERIVKLEAAFATMISNNNGNVSNEIANGSLEQNKSNPLIKIQLSVTTFLLLTLIKNFFLVPRILN